MAAVQRHNSCDDPALEAEQQWSRSGEKLRIVNTSEKALEQKERELQSCIAQNYARIQGVEKELQGLQLQLRLTSGPKKSALEMLRKKIEVQADRVVVARTSLAAANKVAKTATARLAAEEAAKDELCKELNMLVQQSANAQLDALETLTRRLEAINTGNTGNSGSRPEARSGSNGKTDALNATAELKQKILDLSQTEVTAIAVSREASISSLPAANGSHSNGVKTGDLAASHVAQSQKETEQQAIEQQALSARSRHVSINKTSNGTRNARSSSSSTHAPNAAAASQPKNSPFRGFD